MDSNKTNTRTMWIDVAKFMAIIAVLIDHTNGVLYASPYVLYFSYYSVSLFVLIMGITTMWSYSRNSDVLLKTVWNKCLVVIRPYVVATIIYVVILYKSFDFEVVLNHLIRFNISGPFYYVLLYIQLVLVSPILFHIFKKANEKKRGYIIEIVAFLVILCVSSWTTNNTNILGVYGGGGKLFGGTYLILFYLGMWFGKYYKKITINAVVSGGLAVLSFGCTIAWWLFIANDRCQIDIKLPFGEGINPPSISFGLYAILVAATLYFLEKLLLNYPNGFPMKIMEKVAFFGKHTLYVFLYHLLFLKVTIPYLIAVTGIILKNVWVNRIVYFALMIGGSMLIEFVLEKIRKTLLSVYKTDVRT